MADNPSDPDRSTQDALRQHEQQLRLLLREPDDPERIDCYRILERIGHGGQGVVYRAREQGDADRLVAVKVLRADLDDEQSRYRFEFEGRALAMMEHEAIAKVFRIGRTERGRVFLAMELVYGVPIHQYCSEADLPLPDRIRLFERVCAGVEHAHRKQVVHRDLKPTNILVADRDGTPIPKLIDFGIARAVDREALGARAQTVEGRMPGTRGYMAPEQAAGRTAEIDTRTDVYSLGVVLYELLTGAHPFDLQQVHAMSWAQFDQYLQTTDPPRPSQRLTTSEPGRHASLRRELGRDLDWIVLKAMARRPNDRYASVAELAADLQRYRDGVPVVARAPRFGYRLTKFVRRHRAALAGAAVVAIGLAIGSAGVVAAAARSAELKGLRSIIVFDRVLREQRSLFPPWPRNIERMETWVRESVQPMLARRAEIESELARTSIGEASAGAERRVRDTLADLLQRMNALEAGPLVEVDKMLRFARQLERLHARAAAGGAGSATQAMTRWPEARTAIAAADGVVASARYRGQPIELAAEDVVGLVPIGMNPVTQLWEFYDLWTAWDGVGQVADIPVPTHGHAGDRRGSIAVGESTGVILVLLPGGSFSMGATRTATDAVPADPQAGANETLHEVVLEPFFCARHELTIAQWQRLTTMPDPSRHNRPASMRLPPDTAIGTFPVESMSMEQAEQALGGAGLQLPTEAQWEYACRAGTATPWSAGPTRDSLRGAANLADRSAGAAGASWTAIDDWPEFDDGWVFKAPVDAFRPNPWGLVSMHGNVWEWCRDRFYSYDQGGQFLERRGDGLKEVPAFVAREFMLRGGSFRTAARMARAAFRNFALPTTGDMDIGCRAVRPLRQPRG